MKINSILHIFMCVCTTASLLAVIGCTPHVELDENGNCPAPEWENYAPKLISFLNDSIAIYSTSKSKFEYKKSGNRFEGEFCSWQVVEDSVKLWLANYRVKQKPLLAGSLANAVSVVPDYLKDSSVLVIKNLDTTTVEFGFWKIGTNSVAFKEMNGYISVDKASPWKDKNILLIDYGREKLKVLNTKTYKIEPLDTALEQNRWLSSCDRDISYINGKVFCLRSNYEEEFFEFVVDGIVTDTSVFYTYTKFNMNYVFVDHHNNFIEIFKIDTVDFKLEETPNYVNYGAEDFN